MADKQDELLLIEDMDFDQWYAWFTGMLRRKPNDAERSAIKHLLEAQLAKQNRDRPGLREKIEKIMSPIIHIGTSQVSIEYVTDQILALYPDIEELREWYDKLLAEFKALKRERVGEVWYWQGDGGDKLESLACPVLIEVEDLKGLIEQAKSEERERIIEMITGYRQHCSRREGDIVTSIIQALKEGIE